MYLQEFSILFQRVLRDDLTQNEHIFLNTTIAMKLFVPKCRISENMLTLDSSYTRVYEQYIEYPREYIEYPRIPQITGPDLKKQYKI